MDTGSKNSLKTVGRFIYYVMLPIFLSPFYFGTNMFNGFAEESPFLIFILFAAICNAVMDSLENDCIHGTVFSKKNQKFWNKQISATVTKKIFGWKYDAWHVFKSLMVILLALAITSYRPIQAWLIDFFVIGWVWNGYFNVFYNHIFKLKK